MRPLRELRVPRARVPTDGRGHDIRLSGLRSYRVSAVDGDEDVLVTGLPLHPVEETLHRLEAVEALVSVSALLVTGAAGALWVRISLRPLKRVTTHATGVAELPPASGDVAMPGPLTGTDPRTEVGKVGVALNRMLGHVEGRRTRPAERGSRRPGGTPRAAPGIAAESQRMTRLVDDLLLLANARTHTPSGADTTALRRGRAPGRGSAGWPAPSER